MPAILYAQPAQLPVEVAIEQAKQLKLAEKSAWLNLLHYKSSLLRGRRSQVDDKEFFLAEDGATNATAELAADLRGFFSIKLSEHPRCLFPARFHWLDSQLNLSKQLPPVECSPFNRWKEKLNAQQVTLLFPSMYLDNPASMFGHTFIRFDRADNNQLLSNTLSYAASYDESDNVLVYSWKGITGGYPGKFYMRAYFDTLQSYSDIEQRDIWEYKLNLNQQEVDQLIRHLWEVKGAHFEYYFFRENCSFRLLALLDVARENLNMSMDTHLLYAIPVDTVRDIENAGLIDSRNYRPSSHNKITQMSEQLGDDASQAAISIVQGSLLEDNQFKDRLSTFNIEKQARILQMADELLTQKKNLSADKNELQLKILSARSSLPITKEQAEFTYSGVAPEQSHQSARWNIAAGRLETDSTKQQNFYELGLRPAFHDLLDVPDGFANGASITVLDTQLRWYQQQNKLELESLNFFSLQSIMPVKPWVTPVSKAISFKLKQRNVNENERVLEFEAILSAGYAAEYQNILAYFLADAQFEYATKLNNNHAFYLGANAGVLWQFNSKFLSGQTEVKYQTLQNISGEEGNIKKLNLGIQLNIFKNHALRIEYELMEYELFDLNEAKLSYLLYF